MLESEHSLNCISVDAWTRYKMRTFFEKLVLDDCVVGHDVSSCRQYNQLLLFAIRLSAMAMMAAVIGWTLYLLSGLLAKVLDLFKAFDGAMIEACAAVWRGFGAILSIFKLMLIDLGTACLAVITELWPCCTRENIILMTSVVLLIFVLPDLGAVVMVCAVGQADSKPFIKG